MVATIYSWFSGINNEHENYYTLLNEELKKKFPHQLKSVKRGDLFEDTFNERYGYRSFGLSIFEILNDNILVIPLNDYPDDYGTIPPQFKVITQFPIDHWHSDNMPVVCLGGENPGKSYLNNEFVPIDFRLFEKKSNCYKLKYNDYNYIIPYNTFDDCEVNDYVSIWQIKVIKDSEPIDLFEEELEKEEQLEKIEEIEKIEDQIRWLSLEIEAKIQLRDYLKSKMKK